jgi:ATP-dependent protease ClpP protease subunit
MTKLQIRGIILDASWDTENNGNWLDNMIKRGVLTPESRVRMALDKAEAAGDDVEIEICSPGGSVFAGIELANHIAHYPHGLSIRVGAFAASAAALIVLEAARAGRKVAAYRNSILLYHGAWSVTEGGRDAHADTTKLLDQINAPMIDALKAFGVPANRVERGFEEGRQLTMTAAEAAEFGIVGEIIGEDAARFAATVDDANDLLSHGVGGLAAFAGDFDPSATLADNPADETPLSEASASAPIAPESAPGGLTPICSLAPGADALPSDPARTGELEARIAALEAENRSLQSAKDKEIAAVRNALASELDGLKTALRDKTAELDDYRAETDKQLTTLHTELTDWKARYEAEAAARAALVGAVNAPDGDDQPADWPAAVARFGGADALRLYPGLAADYRKRHGAVNRR